jgi:hypothetical protein
MAMRQSTPGVELSTYADRRPSSYLLKLLLAAVMRAAAVLAADTAGDVPRAHRAAAIVWGANRAAMPGWECADLDPWPSGIPSFLATASLRTHMRRFYDRLRHRHAASGCLMLLVG